MLHTQMTMAEAFTEIAESRRHRLALVCGEKRYTYGQLLARVRAAAAALRNLGIRKGDRVASILPPGLEFAALFFAVAQSGAVIVPLNPQSSPASRDHILQDSDPVLVVTDQPAQQLSASPGVRKRIIVSLFVGSDGLNGSDKMELVPALTAAASGRTIKQAPPSGLTPTDLLALLYTSGTTGAPRGTMHTHRSLIAPIVATLKIRELWLRRLNLKKIGQTARALGRYRTRLLRAAGRPQTFLSTVGWHTISGVELMLQGLLMGDRIVVMTRFHPRQAMELVAREKVSVLIAVPTAFEAMLRLPDFKSFNTSTLLICGTGSMPCPPELGRRIQEGYGCALHIGFGATETAGGIAISSLSDSDELQATTVGQALPGVEIRIVDEQHNELPAGQVGELACRGDSVMQGYYGAATDSQVIDADGWYYTGDLAVRDEQGYIRIVGRSRDLIIRGGQNINPLEIENHLVTHPAVREAAVLGVPSRVGGEQVWAFLIPAEGKKPTAREILDHCRETLEAYKIPAQVRFVDDFPRSESGKPQKYQLREQALRQRKENA